MFKSFKIALFLLFFAIRPAFCDVVEVPSTEARYWANTKGHKLIDALSLSDKAVKFAKLDKMMTEDVNLDYISKFVIGKFARIMNKEQKSRYNDLFKRYVLSLYKQYSLDFDAGKIDFVIDSVTEYPKFTTVVCIVDPSQLSKEVTIEKIPVKFKLIRGVNNRIQAIDLDISGVSMVIEYRKRFYQMIYAEDENMDWFLDKFEDKVKANEELIYKNQAQ